MSENKLLLKPKIDIVFHSLFKKGNENISKGIISAITKEKVNINMISKITKLSIEEIEKIQNET